MIFAKNIFLEWQNGFDNFQLLMKSGKYYERINVHDNIFLP